MRTLTWKQLVAGIVIALGGFVVLGGLTGLTALGAAASSSAGGLALTDGSVTVTSAGTAVALGADQSVFAITITALESNSGTVVVGGDTVVAALATRRGRPLTPGETMTISGDPQVAKAWLTPAGVYVDAVTSGDGVTWAALVGQ